MSRNIPMENFADPEKPGDSAYLNCIRCGLCLAVCPTYREYLKETASPRGPVALARKGLVSSLGVVRIYCPMNILNPGKMFPA